MKAVVLLALVALSLCRGPFTHEFYEELKKKADYELIPLEENPFRDYTHEELKAMLGDNKLSPNIPKVDVVSHLKAPATYDFRTAYSNCVFAARNQGNCGSCWSFAGTLCLQFRRCRAGKGKLILSTQDAVSCETSVGYCQGNYMNSMMNYIVQKGLVTDACVPYVAGSGQTLSCPSKCTSGGTWTKYYASSHSTTSGVENIKNAVYNSGPVAVWMMVYDDFYNYRSGIYKHVTGGQVGGHFVNIIGWGSDYWICENSWGANWGESGYFRIYFGQCGIENEAHMPVPKN
ncbi:MAG: hypothetical protein MJ252_30290 [archaeon]|nr:hypothetical protein [archaeon]